MLDYRLVEALGLHPAFDNEYACADRCALREERVQNTSGSNSWTKP